MSWFGLPSNPFQHFQDMTLNNLIRRASSMLGLDSQDVIKICKAEEGEVIYCKNNVCVHPPVPLRTEAEHHPGYLTIRAQHNETMGSTLILTWIPNSSLKKNPQSIENWPPSHSPCRSSRSSTCPSPRRSPRHSLPSIHLDPFGDEESLGNFQVSSKGCILFGSEDFSKTKPSHHPQPDISENKSTRANDEPGYKKSLHDLGIEPEEVTTALEAMISELNNVQPLRKCDASKTAYEIQMAGENLTVHANFDNGSNVLEQQSEIRGLGECAKVHQPHTSATKHSSPNSSPRKNGLKLNLNDTTSQHNTTGVMPNISITRHLDKSDSNCGASSGTSTTSNCDPDSVLPSPSELDSSVNTPGYNPCMNFSSYYIEGTPESLAMVHKLNFPDQCLSTQPNSPSPSYKVKSCSFFSIDLDFAIWTKIFKTYQSTGQMKSLRLFFSNKECTCGQLVIASCESQYKILHFHHGGLDKLADVFEERDFLIKPKMKGDNCPYRQFSICRPEVSKEECHPEEGLYGVVDADIWREYLNEDGQIEEDFHLRKAVFFGGLEHCIRHDAWPFLLHYYPFLSTMEEREQIRNDLYLDYQNIRWKRENLSEDEKEIFWRNIQCTVEKDVVRTDRSKPFFVGDDNPNLEVMRNILLNYAIYNPAMGYTQGMSDLLAPILTEVQNESDTFWCFVGLMQRTIFISSPKDNDMDKHLSFIRELIRLMVSAFYKHLLVHPDAMEMLFCHRWILLCFKREFPDSDALKMWEACWAHYQTDYFHMFICVAIIAIYSEDVIVQGMNADEMLLYFSSLAMHMNGDLVLRKARGLLHQFRQMPRIPCTLQGLCERCDPGMWDSGHVPVVECVGHDGCDSCPSGGECPSL